jgi:hypothetical protein
MRFVAIGSLLACLSCGRLATETVEVTTDIPVTPSMFPASIGQVERGGLITVTVVNVLGGASSCDVIASTSIDDIAGGIEITVTFPAGVSSGEHALADIGGSASLRINDATCAAIDEETTTSGTLWFAQDDGVSGVDLVFSSGRIITNGDAPTCDAESAPAMSACTQLAPCVDNESVGCLQL